MKQTAFFFFFKQKTAYEIRPRDWSSDVCSSDLCNAQTYLEMADEAYANKEYTTALGLYDKALKKPSKSDDLATINFKVAESYRNTGKYDLAIQYYGQAKAAGYTNPNYLFKQGSIYLKQGKYDQAQEKFEAFLAAQPGDKEATLQLNNTKYIKNLPKDSSVFTFKNEAGLNTSFSEYAALPLKNGSVIFTSGRISEKEEKTYSADGQGFSDLYQSTYSKDDKTWTTAKKLDALNSPINEGLLCYCEKTKTAYFDRGNDSKCKSTLEKIYEVSYDESTGTFGTPKPISLSFTQKANMKHPAISTDGNTLYFVSKMEGGLGNYDIWISRRNGDSWGEPVNAGNIINTEFDEAFPVVKDSALLYSTDGLPGFGALDLFVTVNNNGSWSKPQNLKAPFNSSGDDFFIAYNADGKSGDRK